MQELRFVAVSEDGRYAVLAIPGRSARFTLPIDERLRAVALGQTSRLAQYEIEVESPLRPKEIQARIRAGETVEEIADAAGIAVERVRWFEGPVLAERAYMADQARSASVRRQGDATPGPRLGEIVTERMKAFGADPDDAQWDAKKLGDGSWRVQLAFISGGRLHTADWTFDPRRRHALPADDNAARMSLPGTEPLQPPAPAPGEATVTQLAPRLSTAAGAGPMGHGAPGHGGVSHGAPGGPGGPGGPGYGGPGNGGAGNGGRSRHERPVPGRPAAPEPQVAPPQPPERRDTEPPAAVAPPVPSAPPAGPAPVAAQASRVQPGGASQSGGPVQPGRPPQPPQRPQPPWLASPAPPAPPVQEARIAQARGETATTVTPPRPADSGAADSGAAAPDVAAGPAAPAVAAGPAAPAAPVPAPAEAMSPAPAEQPTGEPATRPGRKVARGRRSSVPSWDEIMFGSTRPRD